MSNARRFGISTHLYHGQRLTRDHLLAIAARGFSQIELFATRTHFDYHNVSAIADLQQWLAEARLELNSVHAPIADSFDGNRMGSRLTLASADQAERLRAVAEAEHAIHIARRLPYQVLVVHLGVPRTEQATAGDNSRDAARRSVESLQEAAEPLGVRIALEVIPNELSRAGSLVHFIEETLDAGNVGICLDFGHAHMDGDVADAVETVSEHLIATHVHDNGGRSDDHLLPFEGTIDWPAALTTMQKVGYDRRLMLEIASHGSPNDTLVRAQKACERMDRLMAT